MVARGAHIARVHDVRATVRAVKIIDAIVRSGR
jgi:dihydropteroate synthase